MNAFCVTLIVILSIIAAFIVFKLYVMLSTGWDRSPTCLVGKTAIVTGANTGIGYYTAQDFAKRGARVILACRDPHRAEEARRKIVEATGNQNVVVKIVDLSSLSSVRKFAVEIKAMEERLDILVNNAGAGWFEHTMTSDGLLLTMQINYFGPFLLTVLLIDLLKKSAPSRIVNVASVVSHIGKINVTDLNALPAGFFKKIYEYSNTKLCNVLFSNELARRLKGSGVDSNSLHPGVIRTDLFRNFSPFWKALFTVLLKLCKSAEEGAQTSIYLAVSQDIEGVSGLYFADCKKAWMPRAAKDEQLAKKLWEKSAELVKLTPEERQLLG